MPKERFIKQRYGRDPPISRTWWIAQGKLLATTRCPRCFSSIGCSLRAVLDLAGAICRPPGNHRPTRLRDAEIGETAHQVAFAIHDADLKFIEVRHDLDAHGGSHLAKSLTEQP